MNPELLQKYIAGNATEVEKQRVTGWIQENPENMREYMAQRKLHDMALWRTEPVAEENSRERKHFSLRGICMEAAKYWRSSCWVHIIGQENIRYRKTKHGSPFMCRRANGRN